MELAATAMGQNKSQLLGKEKDIFTQQILGYCAGCPNNLSYKIVGTGILFKQ